RKISGAGRLAHGHQEAGSGNGRYRKGGPMSSQYRPVSLAILMMIATSGIANGQAGPPPLPAPSKLDIDSPPALPKLPAAATPVQVPMPDKLPASKAPAQGQGWEGEVSVKDLVVEATEGQTASNPTGRQEPGISLEWLYPASVRLGQPL